MTVQVVRPVLNPLSCCGIRDLGLGGYRNVLELDAVLRQRLEERDDAPTRRRVAEDVEGGWLEAGRVDIDRLRSEIEWATRRRENPGSRLEGDELLEGPEGRAEEESANAGLLVRSRASSASSRGST